MQEKGRETILPRRPIARPRKKRKPDAPARKERNRPGERKEGRPVSLGMLHVEGREGKRSG